MPAKARPKKRVIIISIILLLTLAIYVYQVTRPTVIFHTHAQSGYLGKVSTISGTVEKLYIKNHRAKYRLPHIYTWNEGDELAIFTKNFNDLFRKEFLDFWILDIYLDENGFYASHTKKTYFWQKKNE